MAERLLSLREEWSGRRLDSDPLELPHRYPAAADREVVAFLAASLAFGRVASIRTSLERLLAPLGPSPAGFLRRWDGGRLPPLHGFVHRWVGEREAHALLTALSRTSREEGSLAALFAAHDQGGEDAVEALDGFLGALRERAGEGGSPRVLRFLFPVPGEGSACKRAHLFLRWMVRSDGLDLGLWTLAGLTPARLLLPMDVHVHRISRRLGLTSRRGADLAAAREATSRLRTIDPADPVSFDWALSRLGILSECVSSPGRSHCERCAVSTVCSDSRDGRRDGGGRRSLSSRGAVG